MADEDIKQKLEETEKAPEGAEAGAPIDTPEETEKVSEESQAAGDAREEVRSDRPPMDWYVLHTYSGYEKKVAIQIRERLKQEGLEENLGEALVPEERVVEIRSGKKRESSRKFFPGYILVEMKMSERVWFIVKETPRITGFLGDSNTPTPLLPGEVERIKEQLSGAAEKPKPKYTYDVGESVRVNDGPFANFTGVLDDVNIERAKVKVMISVFGRPTPVELEFAQIEKI